MNIHTIVVDKYKPNNKEVSTFLRQNIVFSKIKKLKDCSTKVVINNIITILLY